MAVATSIVILAVGAVLTWAVGPSVGGVHVETVGVVLLVVGLAGLVISLAASLRAPRRRQCDERVATGR